MSQTRRFPLKKKLFQKLLLIMGAFALCSTVTDNLAENPKEPWKMGLIFAFLNPLVEDLICVIWFFTHIPHPWATLRQEIGEQLPAKIGRQIARTFTKIACAGIPYGGLLAIEYYVKKFIEDTFFYHLLFAASAGIFSIIGEKLFDRHWTPSGLAHQLLSDNSDRRDIEDIIPIEDDSRTNPTRDTWTRELYELAKQAIELDFNLNLLSILTHDSEVIFHHLVMAGALLITLGRIRLRLQKWAFTPETILDNNGNRSRLSYNLLNNDSNRSPRGPQRDEERAQAQHSHRQPPRDDAGEDSGQTDDNGFRTKLLGAGSFLPIGDKVSAQESSNSGQIIIDINDNKPSTSPKKKINSPLSASLFNRGSSLSASKKSFDKSLSHITILKV